MNDMNNMNNMKPFNQIQIVMKKIFYVAMIATAMFASCDKSQVTTEHDNPSLVRISPLLTRATDTNFEEKDQIGVTITTAGGTYAENAMLEFTGGIFSGTLTWYDTDETSDIIACYPYNAAGMPDTFTVSADQSAGTSSSDFIIGSATGISPSEDAVDMTFRHMFSKIVLDITNDTGAEISSVTLKGSLTTAAISYEDATVSAAPSSQTADILACKAASDEGERYYAILVPQTVALTLEIATSDSEVYTRELEEKELVQGGQHTVTARISVEEGLQVKVAGEIEDWTDEGEIGPDEPEASILKQWVADLSEAQDGSTRKCFDLATEGSILIGDWMPGMEAYMDMFGITDYDPDNSFIAMVTGPETIVSITPSDDTAGTIIYSSDTDMDGVPDTEYTLKYANLTDTTVDITMNDIYSGQEATYSCTAAATTVKVYTYADATGM